MSVSVKRHLFTVDDYHKMAEAGILPPEAKLELIEGEILPMSPINSPHAGCVNRLNALFNQLFGTKAVISVQNPLRIGEWSEPEPDLMLLKPAADFYAERHPIPSDVYLLIEVADASLEKDREIKGPQYAEAGIPHYWIINLAAGCIEAYCRPRGKSYQRMEKFEQGQSIAVSHFEQLIEAKHLLPPAKN